MPTDGSYDAENADFEAVTNTNEQNMRVSEDFGNENAVLLNKNNLRKARREKDVFLFS